ncbi:MAG: ThuA domain-containing protein, partial [Anaerolineae bacterium]|nr:ThuA domain-containing protein [Anaerolineae bacterium]
MSTQPAVTTSPPLTVAVITGGHSYDVINFHQLFRELPGIDAYIQHIDDFAAAPAAVRERYDVLLFYIMMPEEPTDDLPGYRGKPRQALARLGQTDQGILIMHHGLLAYPAWPQWDELVGITDRTLHGYAHDERLALHVADPHHPITQGLADWTLTDETYDMAD